MLDFRRRHLIVSLYVDAITIAHIATVNRASSRIGS
jgi:hypothetical protein